MSATDELRTLLDERGVEYEGGKRSVRWRDRNGVMMQAFPLADGELGMEVWSCTPEQAIAATLGDSDTTGARQRDAVEVVRCRDCKHGHITINGESCKWCDLIATHDIDGNEPNNGYDPEPYFDADFFCAWGRRADG